MIQELVFDLDEGLKLYGDILCGLDEQMRAIAKIINSRYPDWLYVTHVLRRNFEREKRADANKSFWQSNSGFLYTLYLFIQKT